MTHRPHIPPGKRLRAAYSTMEAMVAVVVIGILIAQAVPAYKRATEQAHLDAAAQQLMSIWSAQRVYRLENDAYAGSLTTLRNLNLIDAGIADGSDGFWTFTIASADEDGFQATASRTTGSWSGQLTITQDGQVSGTMNGPDSAVLSPIKF